MEEKFQSDSQINRYGLLDTKRIERGTRRQWTASIIASLGMWSAGSAYGWSSPSVPQLEKENGIDPLSTTQVALVVSLILLAALPGCFLGGYLSDKIGRRTMCILAAFPFTLGWGLVAMAQNFWMLILGRIIMGLSAGIYNVASPVFCIEFSEDRLRSEMMSWNVVALYLGTLYTYILGAVVNWRVNTIISGFTPLLHLAGMIFMPETPRFLVTKGKLNEASKSLQWFRGAETEAAVQEELQKIVRNVEEAKASSNAKNNISKEFSENLFVSSTVKPILICVACVVFQQFSGISAVAFYTVPIFEATGSGIDANVAGIIVGATQAVATAFGGLLQRKFGRKPLFFISEVGMCCSLAVLGGFYFLKETQPETISSLGWLPLATLVTFTVTYCSGAGLLPWTLMADLCPPHVRGIASAICASTALGLGFVVALVFPSLLDSIQGYGAFWLFSGICGLGAVFVAFFLPETKDKTVEEIMNLFKKPNHKNRKYGTFEDNTTNVGIIMG